MEIFISDLKIEHFIKKYNKYNVYHHKKDNNYFIELNVEDEIKNKKTKWLIISVPYKISLEEIENAFYDSQIGVYEKKKPNRYALIGVIENNQFFSIREKNKFEIFAKILELILNFKGVIFCY